MSNPLSRILGWLHAGYPEGVPPKDYYPLLALLTRTLEEDELDQIIATVIRENPDGDISTDDVHETIEKVKAAPIARADVHDVAARLAAVGWPLADLADAAEAVDQELGTGGTGSTAARSAEAPGILSRVDDWLSAGFPHGVPRQDRVPLLALLRRRLTDEEVDAIAHRLVREADEDGTISSLDAQSLIMETTREVPTPQELERVASRLAAKGWPLEREGRAVRDGA